MANQTGQIGRKSDGLTGRYRWARFLGAGDLFQLTGLRAWTFDSAARIATLAQRATFAVQFKFVRAEHTA